MSGLAWAVTPGNPWIVSRPCLTSWPCYWSALSVAHDSWPLTLALHIDVDLYDVTTMRKGGSFLELRLSLWSKIRFGGVRVIFINLFLFWFRLHLFHMRSSRHLWHYTPFWIKFQCNINHNSVSGNCIEFTWLPREFRNYIILTHGMSELLKNKVFIGLALGWSR